MKISIDYDCGTLDTWVMQERKLAKLLRRSKRQRTVRIDGLTHEFIEQEAKKQGRTFNGQLGKILNDYTKSK